jgi:hypothetical protein
MIPVPRRVCVPIAASMGVESRNMKELSNEQKRRLRRH